MARKVRGGDGRGGVNEAETCMGALQRSLVLGPEFVRACHGRGVFSPNMELFFPILGEF